MHPPYTSTMPNDRYWLPQDSSKHYLPHNYQPNFSSSNYNPYLKNHALVNYPPTCVISPPLIISTSYSPSSFTSTAPSISVTNETNFMQRNTQPFVPVNNQPTYADFTKPPHFFSQVPSYPYTEIPPIHSVTSSPSPSFTSPSMSSSISPTSSCLPSHALTPSLPLKKKREYIRRQVISDPSASTSTVPYVLSDPTPNPSILFIPSQFILVLNVPSPYFHFPSSPPPSDLSFLSPFTVCESNQDFKWDPQKPKSKKLTFHRWLPCTHSPFSTQLPVSLSSSSSSSSTSSVSSNDSTHEDDILWFFKDPIKQNRPIKEFLIPSQTPKAFVNPTLVTLRLGSSDTASSFTFVKIKKEDLQSLKNNLKLGLDVS